MTVSTLPFLALQFSAGALAGALLGYAYFQALWWNVSLVDRGSMGKALFMFLTRFALLATTLVLIARLGALPLLAAAAGLLVARRAAIRRFGGAP